MKELKEMLTESTESTVNEAIANTSDDPKDMHALITPGVTETGIYGIILGRPIIFDGGSVVAALQEKNYAEHLVTRTLGLRIGDRPEYTIVKDPAPKSKGRKKTKKIFVYFYDGKGPAYEIPLGSRGVYILKNGFNNM